MTNLFSPEPRLRPSQPSRLQRMAPMLAAATAFLAPGAASAATYTIQNIGIPAQTGGFAYALNNAGEVATTSLVESFTYTDTTFSSSQKINIPNVATSTPGVVAQGMNDLGEVAGRFRTAGNPANQTSGFVLRTNGTIDTFNYPSLSSTSVSAINDAGVLVGETRSDLTPFGVIRGFRYESGTYSEIHVTGATLTRAYGINDGGIIVGQYQNADAINRPFIFSAGTYTEITLTGAPGGVTSAFATGISDSGSIIGSYRNSANVSSTWVRLADGSFEYPVLPGIGWSINDSGQISGSYLDAANGNTRTAFLATPVPEPGNLLMLGGSALALLRRKRPSRQ